MTATVGILALSVTCIGWLLIDLAWYERAVSFGASLLLIQPNWTTDTAGFAVFGGLALLCFLRARRRRAALSGADD